MFHNTWLVKSMGIIYSEPACQLVSSTLFKHLKSRCFQELESPFHCYLGDKTGQMLSFSAEIFVM